MGIAQQVPPAPVGTRAFALIRLLQMQHFSSQESQQRDSSLWTLWPLCEAQIPCADAYVVSSCCESCTCCRFPQLCHCLHLARCTIFSWGVLFRSITEVWF